MRKLLTIFVVSYATGVQYNSVPCKGKEDPGVVCAMTVTNHAEKAFKTEEAADEFKNVMIESHVNEVKMEKRAK